MSVPEHRRPDVAREAPAVVPAGEQDVLHSPSWPTGRLAAAALSAAVLALLLVPAAAAGSEAVALAVLVVPAFGGAVCGRLVLEAAAPPAASPARRLAAAVAAAFVALAVTQAAAAGLGLAIDGPALATSAAGLTALFALATVLRRFEIRLRVSGRRVFFVGGAGALSDLRREIARRGDLQLVGHLGLDAERRDVDALVSAVLAARPTTLVLSGEAIRRESLVAMASLLNLRGLRVRPLDEFYEREFAKIPLSELSPSWFLFDVAEIHDPRLYGAVKRVFETVLAATVLLVTAPLLPLVAAAVRLSGPGPVLFRQARVGRGGEIFMLTKFRTMRPADDAEPSWAPEQADRITPVGRVLRRFRIDELPQLWHVVRGQMSLVGPRPEQPAIVERLTREIEFYGARHHVRPGITGWAQVNHGYGGSDAGTLEKLQFEFFYIKHQSLQLDLRILAATVRTVLRGRGL
ncbi:MAG TPA: exopolysaccharide biosynthesis polyprenyl glycosylphosphotransferase [Solirubrobacteraceae bacterium]|nr:exopolysaccharide biosynthesis polyprenyl glycosylphosphotransferase [Solirubrobacteraceae bacterium]